MKKGKGESLEGSDMNIDNEFESKLQELEKIVKDMENKDMSLSEGIVAYQKAIKLYKNCTDSIKGLEKKVDAITEEFKKADSE